MPLYNDSSLPVSIDTTPSTNATIFTGTIGTASVQLLSANSTRKGFSIFNNSSRIVYLGVNANVSTSASYFVKINANSLYEWGFASIYTGAVFAIANGANANCQVLEITP